MHNLDVTNLLIKAASAEKESSITGLYNYLSTSRASSSLDLEWEHEYGQIRNGPSHQYYQHLQQQSHYQNDGPGNIIVNKGANDDINEEAEEYWPFNKVNCDALSRVSSIASITDYPPIFAANRNYRKVCLRPQNVQQQQQIPTQLQRNNGGGGLTRNSSCHSWSHMSTSESLEWDIDAEQQQKLLEEDDENLDDDTIQLLHQIEELKTRVLDETGVGLYTDYTKYLQEFNSDLEATNNSNNATLCHTNSIILNNYSQFTDSDQENANYS